MNKHKWHKEIKAWADGAEIQCRDTDSQSWFNCGIEEPYWNDGEVEYRIKPQPKEQQYLYVYQQKNSSLVTIVNSKSCMQESAYIGKIKLEQDDE